VRSSSTKNRGRKLRLIARREYLINVRRRSFLYVTFGLPLLFLLMMALGVVSGEASQGDPASVGYVDQSGVLSGAVEDPGFRAFASLDEAGAALEARQIRGYFAVPADYRDSGRVELLYWDRQPNAGLQAAFDSFLRSNLVAGLAPDVATRLLDGPDDMEVRSIDGTRVMRGLGVASLVLPFALGLFFSFALMNASSYLLRAVADEKENRTVEIVATSVSPTQLVAGKAAGLIGVALTQIVLWALVVVGGVALASIWVDALAAIEISWRLVTVLVAYFVPLFVLAATLMIIVGVAVSDTRQGQAIAGGFSFLFLLPLFFSPLLGSNPDSPIMVVLTLFPTTSMLAIAVRWSATLVPLWQLITSWVLLAGCAAAGLWMAPRVFRQGMLRYGHRMRLRSVLRAARARA
jgi:ABC-2 type transport system permease protein